MNKRLNYIWISACLVVAVASLQSCYYDNAEELYPIGEVSTCDTISFSSGVEPIISANCATPGCHVSGTGREPLTNYTEIKSAVDNHNLGGRVESGSMPLSGSLPTAEITTISCWIEQGAINN